MVLRWNAYCLRRSRSQASPLQVWNVKTGQVLWEKRLDVSRVYAVSWSPDGHLIAVGGDFSHQVGVLDAETGVQRLSVFGVSQPIRAMTLSPDGVFLAWGGDRSTSVNVWKVGQESQPVVKLKGVPFVAHADDPLAEVMKNGLQSLAFSNGG